MPDPLPEDVPVAMLSGSGQDCGEGCGRPAVVEIDGENVGYTYCGECLLRAVLNAAVFEDAIAEFRRIGDRQ